LEVDDDFEDFTTRGTKLMLGLPCGNCGFQESNVLIIDLLGFEVLK